MAQDLKTLLRNLVDSGVLTDVDFDALQHRAESLEADATEVAQELMRDRKLTAYQFGILCGESKDPLTLGEYVILERIGEGGMGVVFRVIHRETRRIQALKVLPDRLAQDDSAIRRFQREISTAAKLSHPNIVATIDSGDLEGTAFLTMEYVDGHDLAELVREHGSLPVWTVMDCAVPIARALAYAHSQKIIHRDIKPSNVLIDHQGTIRVLDMGLARLLPEPADSLSVSTVADLTRSGTVLGTADYMAPEQAANARNSDDRTDIYSLGCTIYFLVAGHPMYSGDTVMEKIIAHREEPIPSLHDKAEKIPPKLESLYRRMVAKKAVARPQTMTAVLEELEAIRNDNQYTWAMQRIVARRKTRWPCLDI